jgi:hypothetical protein
MSHSSTNCSPPRTEQAAIEFSDPRYEARFESFPMPHPFRELVGMIPAELPRRAPAQIGIPDAVTARGVRPGRDRIADMVAVDRCPDPIVPGIRHRSTCAERQAVRRGRLLSPLLETQSQNGTQNGHQARRRYTDGIGFRYQGGQIRSLLSLLSYLGSGEYRERYLGVPIPPTNLQDYHLKNARTFVSRLADTLAGNAQTA